MTSRWTARWTGCVGLAALVLLGACTDRVPTSTDEGLIPVDAETLEIRIPFSEFGGEFSVHEGFGSAAALARPFVASEYRGTLDAHTLLRFVGPPSVIQIFPPGEDQTRPDSLYTITGGELVLHMDTLTTPPQPLLDVAVEALQVEWHFETASWTHAVDTLGGESLWPEPGGGPVREVDLVSWNPAEADSLVFQVDSFTANEWADTDLAFRGARVSARTPGALLHVRSAEFRPALRASIDPDTTVMVSLGTTQSTFVFSPDPGVDPTEIRVAGTPARRAYIELNIPRRLEVGSEACADLPCPVDLTAERVVFAGLVLETVPSPQEAFVPLDTLRMDVRPALAPERVPRSPLGSPVTPSPRVLLPEWFEVGGSRQVEVPMTRYIRDLLRPEDPDRGIVPNTITFLSATEPSAFPIASFAGPGQEGEPFLRIILTLSDGVRLP